MKKSKKVVGALLGMALTGATGAFAQSGCGTNGACGSQKNNKSDMNKTMSGCGSQKAGEKLKKAASGGCGASK